MLIQNNKNKIKIKLLMDLKKVMINKSIFKMIMNKKKKIVKRNKMKKIRINQIKKNKNEIYKNIMNLLNFYKILNKL